MKGWAEDFSAVLAEEGIPAYSVSREGYFETYEVSVLLDYLKILDNGRQDLPLAAVLASPLGNLLTEDMAKIRVAYPDVPFHESARMYASEEAQDPVLKDRLMRFFSQVDHFRKKVSYTPIHDLLTEIIEETGFGIYISAMEGGVQRAANVEMLVEKAKAFEGTSYKGLFHFVRYIEQLKKYDVDYGEAGIMDEQADTVRIMSIHKSKGLEFPVVFAAGMGKQFNTQDTKSSMILHPEWEKLIMTGVLPDRFIMRSGKDGVITAGAKSYFDWIIPALWSEEEEAALEDAPVCIFQYTGNDIGADILQVKSEQLALDVLKHWDVTKVYDPEIRKCLDEQADYVYPYYSEGGMKMKFTVSELKKRKALQEEAGEEMYKEPQTVPLLPRFIKRKKLFPALHGEAHITSF